MKNNIDNSHRKKRFNLRVFSVIICLCAIGSTLVGLSVDWSRPSWIFIAGSSTMQPLLEKISNVYKKAEISANSGGSALGISGVLNDKKNIGAISKSPSVNQAGLPGLPGDDLETSNEWEKNKIKTVTISRDPIAIIYKSNEEVILDNDNIPYLYLAFAGYSEIDFNKLLKNNTTNKQKIVPYARAGGSRESGTADAFLTSNNIGSRGSKEFLETISVHNTEISKVNSEENKDIWSVLKSGEYGLHTKQTNETSLETWENIKEYNQSGVPVTYLNGSFIKNNLKEIQSKGFKIAKYKTSDGDLISSNNFNDNYNWFHPLNLLLRTNSSSSNDSKLFIEWIIGSTLFENSDVYKIFNEISFTVLKPKIIKTMFGSKSEIIDDIYNYAQQHPKANYYDYINDPSTNKDWSGFWLSDYELYDIQKDERNNLKEYYGAIFTKK